MRESEILTLVVCLWLATRWHRRLLQLWQLRRSPIRKLCRCIEPVMEVISPLRTLFLLN